MEGHLDGAPEELRDAEEVVAERGREVEPIVHLLPRDDEEVAGLDGLGGEDGEAPLVSPDKAPRDLASEDASEDGSHGCD